jgi:hypothetical protein
MGLWVWCSILATPAMAGDVPWNGPYLGGHIGGESSRLCRSWMVASSGPGPEAHQGPSDTQCAGSAALGGVQAGDMIQQGRVAFGLALDVDMEAAKNRPRSLAYAGTLLPSGTYSFSDEANPSGLIRVGPRLAYAADVWSAYLVAGAAVPFDARNSSLTITAAGTSKPLATVDGGRNFSTLGRFAGFGVDIGLNGAWVLGFEFVRADIGRGSSGQVSCSGAAFVCAALASAHFDSGFDRAVINQYHVGIAYWFNYWEIGGS